MRTEWSRPTKYVAGVALAILGLYVLYLSRSVFSLLILATLIAFFVRPIINLLHNRLKLPRGLSVLVTYLGVLIIFLLAPIFLIPAILNAIDFVLSLDYQAFIQNSLRWIENTLVSLRAREIPLQGLDDYVDRTIDSVLDTIQNATPTVTPEPPSVSVIVRSLGSAVTVTFGVAAGLVGSVFSSVVLFIFMLLASIYISLSAHTWHGHFLRIVPPAYRPEMTILLARLGKIWVAFFRGQVTLMIIIGVVVWLGLATLGIPGAFSLGIISGLLEIIPNLGPVLAAIPGIIVALLQGSTYLAVNNFVMALIVTGFYVLVQQLENSIIVPKVLGDAVELPPLPVMTGVLIGASVGGILGALLATPVIASGKEIVRYVYRKMLEQEPFPTETEDDTSAVTKSVSGREPGKTLGARVQRLFQRRPEAPVPAQVPPPTNPDEGQS